VQPRPASIPAAPIPGTFGQDVFFPYGRQTEPSPTKVIGEGRSSRHTAAALFLTYKTFYELINVVIWCSLVLSPRTGRMLRLRLGSSWLQHAIDYQLKNDSAVARANIQ
jgi:hypothetical protein